MPLWLTSHQAPQNCINSGLLWHACLAGKLPASNAFDRVDSPRHYSQVLCEQFQCLQRISKHKQISIPVLLTDSEVSIRRDLVEIKGLPTVGQSFCISRPVKDPKMNSDKSLVGVSFSVCSTQLSSKNAGLSVAIVLDTTSVRRVFLWRTKIYDSVGLRTMPSLEIRDQGELVHAKNPENSKLLS